MNENAVIPSYSEPGDSGLDLVATSKWYDDYGNVCFGTGLAFEIPEGYAGFLFPRSSVSKVDLTLTNCVGVVDSGYRGEVMVKFKPTLAFVDYDKENSEKSIYSGVAIVGDNPYSNSQIMYWEANSYEVGDRVCQLIIMQTPKIELVESDTLSDSKRGTGGFGSTGK